MIDVCFECRLPAKYKHHVVPKSLGGTKTVPLCEGCHSKIHQTDLRLSALQKEAVKKAVAKCKAEGRKWGGGGWNKVRADRYPKVKAMRESGMKLKDIAAEFNLSIPTIWKILKFYGPEQQTSNTKSEV